MARRSRSRSPGSERRRRSHDRERGGKRSKDRERDRHKKSRSRERNRDRSQERIREKNREKSRERNRDRSRSREKRDRSRSREKRDRSRSREKRDRSRSREKRDRSRSREKRDRSRSREKRDISRSREKRDRSRSREKRDRSRSREKRDRSRSREKRDRSRSREKRDRSRSREKRDRSRSREKLDGSRSKERRDRSRSREKRERSQERSRERKSRDRKSRDRSHSRERRVKERGRRSRSRQRGSYHSREVKHRREDERSSRQRYKRDHSSSDDDHHSRGRDWVRAERHRQRSRSRNRHRSRSRDRQDIRHRETAESRKSDRYHRIVSDRRGQKTSRDRRSSRSERRRRKDSSSSSGSSSDDSSDDHSVKKDDTDSSSSTDEDSKDKIKHQSTKSQVQDPAKTKEKTQKGKSSSESDSDSDHAEHKRVLHQDEKVRTVKAENKSNSEDSEDGNKPARKPMQPVSRETEGQAKMGSDNMTSPSVTPRIKPEANNESEPVKDGQDQSHKAAARVPEAATRIRSKSPDPVSSTVDQQGNKENSSKGIELVKEYSDSKGNTPESVEPDNESEEHLGEDANDSTGIQESVKMMEDTENKLTSLPSQPAPAAKEVEVNDKAEEDVILLTTKATPDDNDEPYNQAHCDSAEQNENTVISKEEESQQSLVEKDKLSIEEPCSNLETSVSEAEQNETAVASKTTEDQRPEPSEADSDEAAPSEELKSLTRTDEKKPEKTEPEESSSEEGEIKDDESGSGRNSDNEYKSSDSERNEPESFQKSEVTEKYPLYVDTITGKHGSQDNEDKNLELFEKAGTSGVQDKTIDRTENDSDSERRLKSHKKEKSRRGSDASESKKKKHKKHRSRHPSSSSDSDIHSKNPSRMKSRDKESKKKRHDRDLLVKNYDSDETTEQELLRKKRQLEEQVQIEEEIRQRSKIVEREREAARNRKMKSTIHGENQDDSEKDEPHVEESFSKGRLSHSRSRSQSQDKHTASVSDKKHKRGRDEKRRKGEKRSRRQSSDEDGSFECGQGSEEPQIGGRYWGDEERKDPSQHKVKQFKTSDTYWNKYADKLGIQIEDPRNRGQDFEKGRDRDNDWRREPWVDKQHRDDQDGSKRDKKKVEALEKKENKTDVEAKPLIKKPVMDPLSSRTGGAYIPPAKLKMMQAQITDKSSDVFQRLAWEALKKSINGLVNKVNVSNIGIIVRELLKENIVRGRGLLCRALMQAQAFSPTFTHVYAALVAIINSKFPQIGELLLKRLVIQFRRGVRRNDKNVCTSSCRFIAHLVNQQVAHEVVALEVLTFLLERAKNIADESEVAAKSRNDSCELAISFLTECGEKLNEVSPRGMKMILETFRNILHEGKLEQRVAYMLEVIFATVKDGFKDHPAVIQELDLVEENDQFTHIVELDGKMDGDDILNVFRHDPQYEENEEKYKEIRAGILGDDSDESGSEGGSESGSESDDEEEEEEEAEGENQTIMDHTETNLVAFRRMVYLTIQSSLDVDECAHKLLKGEIKPGWETELCNMILDCCAQQRTYIKFYGLLAQRFCNINKVYQEPFQQIFKDAYDTCHRLETEKLRNVARLFAHLLFSDAISWEVLSHIHLNEDETTSSSRVFVKILFQELAEFMSLARLNERLREPTLAPAFEGLLPRDNPRNTRFAINFFTSCGLGGLTDDLREFLRTQPKPTAVVAPVQQQMSKTEDNGSGSSSGSSSDSDSSSSSSGSESSSSSSSDSSSSSSDSSSSDSDSSSDSSDSSESSSSDSDDSTDDDRKKKKHKKEPRKREAKDPEREKLNRKTEQRSKTRGRRNRSESEEEISRQEESTEIRERHRDERAARRERSRDNHPRRSRQDDQSNERRKRNASGGEDRSIVGRRSEEEQPEQRKKEDRKERKRRHNSEDGRDQEQRREENGERDEKRKKRHDSGERESKKHRSHQEDRDPEREERRRSGREKVGHHSDDERKKDRKHRHR